MKFTTVILICLLFMGCATWTKSEKVKEACYGFLQALEVEQTIYGIEKLGLKEANPIYGDHPSAGKIRTIGFITGLGHFLITTCLKPKYRASFQDITLGFKIVGNGWNLCVILRR